MSLREISGFLEPCFENAIGSYQKELTPAQIKAAYRDHPAATPHMLQYPNIEFLPTQILSKILRLASPRPSASISRTCRRFNFVHNAPIARAIEQRAYAQFKMKYQDHPASKPVESGPHILSLPDEILSQIMDFSSTKFTPQIEISCRRMYVIDARVTREQFLRNFFADCVLLHQDVLKKIIKKDTLDRSTLTIASICPRTTRLIESLAYLRKKILPQENPLLAVFHDSNIIPIVEKSVSYEHSVEALSRLFQEPNLEDVYLRIEERIPFTAALVEQLALLKLNQLDITTSTPQIVDVLEKLPMLPHMDTFTINTPGVTCKGVFSKQTREQLSEIVSSKIEVRFNKSTTLDSSTFSKILEIILNMKTLRKLCLSGSFLEDCLYDIPLHQKINLPLLTHLHCEIFLEDHDGRVSTWIPYDILRIPSLKKLYLYCNAPSLDYPSLFFEESFLPNLTKLTLNRSTHTVPSWIGRTTPSLETLRFEGLSPTAIPEELSRINLKRLDLFDGSLSLIPRGIGVLSNLEVLDVSSNELVSLPEELAQLNIKRLLLSLNELQSIPPWIGTMRTLEELDVTRNEITDLPEELSQSNIKKLNVSACLLPTVPSCIFRMKALEVLNLYGNPIVSLPTELERVSSLKKIVVKLGAEGVVHSPVLDRLKEKDIVTDDYLSFSDFRIGLMKYALLIGRRNRAGI